MILRLIAREPHTANLYDHALTSAQVTTDAVELQSAYAAHRLILTRKDVLALLAMMDAPERYNEPPEAY